MKRFQMILSILITCLVVFSAGLSHAGDSDIWDAFKSGNHFAIMRHAIAPGFDDPPNFQIGDCSTQRNLSDEGRQQAREIGEQFRANGINRVRVFSSQWCRCLETARLLELGPVQELPVLNSFFRKFKRQESQTRALKEWLAQQDLAEPLVLVTHQVNITALTKVTPAPGEVVIVKQTAPGEFLVVGTFQTD